MEDQKKNQQIYKRTPDSKGSTGLQFGSHSATMAAAILQKVKNLVKIENNIEN